MIELQKDERLKIEHCSEMKHTQIRCVKFTVSFKRVGDAEAESRQNTIANNNGRERATHCKGDVNACIKMHDECMLRSM